MKNKSIVVYGASGYTGKLFVKHLINLGVYPILAGRNKNVETLGKELNCQVKIFETKGAEKYLQGVDVLINFAGPFSKTQDELILGCIKSKTHYLDIAGEVAEVKNAHSYHKLAKKEKIILLSAAGFGVVPTDIASYRACKLIDNPEHLTIIYATQGGVSRGTLKTVLNDINKEGVVLKNGFFKKAMPAEKTLNTEVFGREIKAVNNPWRADLFTSQISTQIPNIQTFSEFPSFIVSMMKGRLSWLRNFMLKWLVNVLPEGPNDKQLKNGNTFIKVIVKNENNETGIVTMKGPEAYLFTLICVENMLRLVLSNSSLNGFITPSQLDDGWIDKVCSVESIRLN